MEQPGRRHPAHGVRSMLGQPTIVFLTVCTKDRAPWLAGDEVHVALREAWQSAASWLVGRYVLMPDHLHMFCTPVDEAVAFETWVRFWKSEFRRKTGRKDWRWQTHHWDTRLRGSESYAEKWEYVRHNPVRAGLVTDAERWRYQGECHRLMW